MSGPDNMEYDSTGAGEFVKPVPIGAARPGANAAVPSTVTSSHGGDGQIGVTDTPLTAPQGTPPGGGQPMIARDGGVQRIPS